MRLFRDHGVEKIRITGGEPLVRRKLERLIEMLAYWDDLDLTLTTNGSLLKQKARDLQATPGSSASRSAWIRSTTRVFRAMNDVDFPVQQGAGGHRRGRRRRACCPIKVNMVVKRGVNDHSVLPMARYFRDKGHILRFIEFMDVGATNGWKMEHVVPSRELVETHPGASCRSSRSSPTTSARSRSAGATGTAAARSGFISSVTQAFCRNCTRARLSAEGQLYTCLFATQGTDFRSPLRGGASDEDISELIGKVWTARADRYSEVRTAETATLRKVEMSYIGG